MQSRPTTQAFPLPQPPQVPPPQSTSVSTPFFTVSVHVGLAHLPPLQTPLTQSAPLPQPSPSAHGAHEPPQSRSVSAPFLILSLHEAFEQRLSAPHSRSTQSRSSKQPSAALHGAHSPPQST